LGYFLPGFRLCNNFAKKWDGLHFGRFHPKSSGADFSYIFSAENSAEFLGKTIFQNFFRVKFHFIPTFLGGKFSAEFSPKCMKNRPQVTLALSTLEGSRGHDVQIGPSVPDLLAKQTAARL
jgi:hypothetical protein